ncbi:hypothetical protein DKM28_02195 [Methanosarcina mazei]|uniref:Uncharacterized protein n=1 Tax=Methanosarcina mazei TaxID=2209 RepID=A0A4P8R291_METMZ|nr:hypothetical protein DKM28_02195 [Methanosarcina mazei]
MMSIINCTWKKINDARKTCLEGILTWFYRGLSWSYLSKSEAKRSDIKVFNLGVNALLKAGMGMYDYF